MSNGMKAEPDSLWMKHEEKSGEMSQVEQTHREVSGMANLTSISKWTLKLSIPNTLFGVYELTVC